MTRTLGIIAASAMIFASANAMAASSASWDTNDDGVISNEEFMKEYDKDDKEFSAWDSDKDGQISREEYRSHVFGMHDSDKDGQLNETEYKMYDSSHWGVGTRGQLPKPGDSKQREQ